MVLMMSQFLINFLQATKNPSKPFLSSLQKLNFKTPLYNCSRVSAPTGYTSTLLSKGNLIIATSQLAPIALRNNPIYPNALLLKDHFYITDCFSTQDVPLIAFTYHEILGQFVQSFSKHNRNAVCKNDVW